jgi:G6PDH family F420-dependent oxidoreductase
MLQPMTTFGYTLSSEEHAPRDLVTHARQAEEAGFAFVSISDHFHPWVTEQGHSPFVWSVLGGIAEATERIDVGVGVTCPIMRIHPAIVAHAVATTAQLLDDRLFFGVGTGESLNEHIFGQPWPAIEVRREMLEEAIEVMRRLWTGETVAHRGRYFQVERAKLFDPPNREVPVIVSAFGPKAAALAGRVGDGLWGTSPDAETVRAFADAGGAGPKYAQLNLCWDSDEERARKTAYRIWPNAGVPGQLSQDLPTWQHFEMVTEVVTEEEATKSTPCGPDIVDELVESVRSYEQAGFDHLYFHQIGPDQEGFFEFWRDELEPALRKRS